MTAAWILLAVVGGLILLYVVILFGVAVFSIKPPRMPQFVTPGLMGEAHDTISIKTSDGHTLRAWWVPAEGDTTVVFAHGYFTNRCEFVPFVSRFKARGASCLFFDHRAHGTSTGKRCTFGVEEIHDVAAAVAWVKQNRPNDKIMLVGNSMGALACALYTAEDATGINGLVLDSPYARVDEGAKGWWTFFARGKFKRFLRPTAIFGSLIAQADLKSIDLEHAVAKIRNVPILMMFGEEDPLISREKIEKCMDAAGPHAEVEWFGDSNHARARFRRPEQYSAAMFGFMARHKIGKPLPEDFADPATSPA